MVIDDVDRAGPLAASVVGALARRISAGSAGVVVTSAVPFGVETEQRIARLTEQDVAQLTEEDRHDVARALWLASRGLPGPALTLASSLRAGSATDDDDPLVQLALGASAANEFLDVDASVVGLLEDATRQDLTPGQRARVLARLAGQLLGDTSTTARRGALIDEATVLAAGPVTIGSPLR